MAHELLSPMIIAPSGLTLQKNTIMLRRRKISTLILVVSFETLKQMGSAYLVKIQKEGYFLSFHK